MKRTCLCYLTLFVLTCAMTSGQVLLEDTWADGDRTGTNLPGESATWVSDADSISISPGSFQYTQDGSSNRLWTHFAPDGAPVTLNVGDQLITTIKFTPRTSLYDNSSKSFRFCVVNDPTNGQVLSDTNDDGGGDGDPWADSRGYGVMMALSTGATKSATPSVGKHTGFAGTSLMGTTGDWTMTSGGNKIVNTLDTLYTLTLTLDYVAADQMDVVFAMANAGGVISTHTYTDTTDIATSFDHLFFRFSNNTQTADVLDFHELKVEYIPEPATLGLLGLGSLAAIRRRR
jgi:hypothetical protein